AELHAAQDKIAFLELAPLYQNVRYRPTPLLELRFQHHAACRYIERRLELKYLGLYEYGIQQRIDALTGLRRDIYELCFAAPFFRNDVKASEFLFYPIRVCFRLIDLVDRHYQRNVGGAGMLHRFA